MLSKNESICFKNRVTYVHSYCTLIPPGIRAGRWRRLRIHRRGTLGVYGVCTQKRSSGPSKNQTKQRTEPETKAGTWVRPQVRPPELEPNLDRAWSLNTGTKLEF